MIRNPNPFSTHGIQVRIFSQAELPLCCQLRPGNLLKPGQGMIQQFPEGGAEIVVGTSRVRVPVVFAAAVAEGAVGAGGAFHRLDTAPMQKRSGLFAGCHIGNGHLPDAADFPVVQHKEIAGIGGAVTLKHQIGTAFSAGGAGAGAVSQQDMDIVLKQPDAMVISLDPVPVP